MNRVQVVLSGFSVRLLIIIFILSQIFNVHRDTSSVDYITLTYVYNN